MKKVSIIGSGNVGSSLAQLLASLGISDIVLFDVVEGMPQGKALDMSHACPLWESSSSVKGTNDYADTAGSEIVVITAGLARKPGMSRDDLLHANAEIMKSVAGEVTRHSPNAFLIVVTNPMDVMAQLVSEITNYPSGKVIGMGGVLDSARLRTFTAWEAGVSVKDVEAMVLGGHGDQMVPLARFTTVKGVPITELFTPEKIAALIERTRHGGAEIVSLLRSGSAYYAPAAATYDMVRSILFDEKRMLPCAVRLNGQYGLEGMFAGVPVVLGRHGVENIIELKLTEEERKLLEASARAVKALVDRLRA